MSDRFVDEKTREFLRKLTALTREYGLSIGGCGCCSSPWVEVADTSDDRAGYGWGFTESLHWIAPGDDYSWREYSESIVR